MSKELINEIESKIAWNDKNIDETSISLRDVKRLLNELEEQAERVQELELEVSDWRAKVQKWQQFYEESEESHLETKELLKSIVNQNKRYREAMTSALSEIKYAIYSKKTLEVKEHYLRNAKRYIEKALEGEK